MLLAMIAFDAILWRCYDGGVMVVLQWRYGCYGAAEVVLRWFTVVSRSCYGGVVVVLRWCHGGYVTVGLRWLWWCYGGVSVMLRLCYGGVLVAFYSLTVLVNSGVVAHDVMVLR